jgi:hypothetical protein
LPQQTELSDLAGFSQETGHSRHIPAREKIVFFTIYSQKIGIQPP